MVCKWNSTWHWTNCISINRFNEHTKTRTLDFCYKTSDNTKTSKPFMKQMCTSQNGAFFPRKLPRTLYNVDVPESSSFPTMILCQFAQLKHKTCLCKSWDRHDDSRYLFRSTSRLSSISSCSDLQNLNLSQCSRFHSWWKIFQRPWFFWLCSLFFIPDALELPIKSFDGDL